MLSFSGLSDQCISFAFRSQTGYLTTSPNTIDLVRQHLHGELKRSFDGKQEIELYPGFKLRCPGNPGKTTGWALALTMAGTLTLFGLGEALKIQYEKWLT